MCRIYMLSRRGMQQAHGQDCFCHAQAIPADCCPSQVGVSGYLVIQVLKVWGCEYLGISHVFVAGA